jgi:4-hydroxy-4-methyl-2-oxoglutarate aldolase
VGADAVTVTAGVAGPHFDPVPAEWAHAARLGPATLHEAGGRTGAVPSAIVSITGLPLVGPAFPVLSPPGDNLWWHRAVYVAPVGAVLVVDVGPGQEYGYWGEILAEAAMARGLRGLVTNGQVRDVTELRTLGFPVFAVGACIRGTGKDPDSPGRLGAPVTLGDVEIAAGDLVVGDTDGVVVVPVDQLRRTLAAGDTRTESERRTIEQLRSGATTLDLYGLDGKP